MLASINITYGTLGLKGVLGPTLSLGVGMGTLRTAVDSLVYPTAVIYWMQGTEYRESV